ncbi:MAG: CvpA family protein [Clostridiales bacterium]|nr:CvpA family protein [Clostridiales bacterium]
MTHIIDLILIALMLLIVLISAKRGIVLTVFDIASGFVSFLLGRTLSEPAANWIYSEYVRDSVIDFLDTQLKNAENGISNVITDALSLLDFLPDGAVALLENSAEFDLDTLTREIINGAVSVSEIEAEFVGPVVISLIKMAAFAAISFAAVVVFRILSKIISRFIRSSKIAGGLDTVLGGVFGILKGAIYICIAAAVINVISYASVSLAQYAADSYICTFVSDLTGF